MAARRTFPLTSYQRDIWAAESRSPNDPQFNVVLDERVDGKVDTRALSEALVRTLRRHDAFRLRFGERDGVPYQWVAEEDEAALVVEFADLSGEADPAAAWQRWQERSFARPFPLLDSPLVTAALIRETPDVLHVHVNAHHLIVDAWTLNHVSRGMWEEYARLTTAPTVPSGPVTGSHAGPAGEPAPSYRAFADAETAYHASAQREEDRAFHRAALTGVAPVLFQRSPGRALSGAGRRGHFSFTVPGEVVRRARQAGSSPFAYVTAAFAAYLARVHRSDEVVLGVPFLNRRDETELATAGQFANNLPLRVPVSEDATLHDLAAAVRERARALREHERLALGDILRDLPAGDTGGRRLFDVTVSYLRYPRPEALPDAERDTVITAPVHAQDALSVMIRAFDDDADLRVDLDYARDVFDEDFPIEAFAGHLTTLLRAGVEDPGRPAAAQPVLTAREREELARVQHGPAVPYRDDATLHGLFEEQAARMPDRTAVTAADGTALSYAELDARANRIARALRAEGVVPGDRVAVLLGRGPHTLPALLGVLKSGAAYVPVDPGYPAERIAFLLQDSRARAVLTAPGSPDAEVPAGVPVLRADQLAAVGSAEPLPPAASSRDLAYVIYTSGSTGRPKGVMVEHHSVVNRLAWMQERYPVAHGDVLLQKTPISFDVSVWELFWWAVEGARLALLPPGGERDPRTILRTVAERQVTTLHFVPSMLGPFLDLLEADPALRAEAGTLRTVFCSGEALPPARVEQFARVFGRGWGSSPGTAGGDGAGAGRPTVSRCW